MCNTTDQNGDGMHVDIEVPGDCGALHVCKSRSTLQLKANDIPSDTGAVFTLGKSYLYDDTIKEQTTPQYDGIAHSPHGQRPKTPNGKDVPTRQQSYFFVKNDPIVKIVCGSKQSGVICGE